MARTTATIRAEMDANDAAKDRQLLRAKDLVSSESTEAPAMLASVTAEFDRLVGVSDALTAEYLAAMDVERGER